MGQRSWIAFVVGLLVGALSMLGSTLNAQQTSSRAPHVLSPHGFIVEEVRVGQSCVVIVSRGGPPSEHLAAISCAD
jgi:hypothetical protein